MTNDQRNEAILKALKERTSQKAKTEKLARQALIDEGIYTQKGKLRVAFGGTKRKTTTAA